MPRQVIIFIQNFWGRNERGWNSGWGLEGEGGKPQSPPPVMAPLATHENNKAYSEYLLRSRVVFKFRLEGRRRIGITQDLLVSGFFANKILQLYNQTEDVKRKYSHTSQRILPSDYQRRIDAMAQVRPDLTAIEFRNGCNVINLSKINFRNFETLSPADEVLPPPLINF